MFSTRWICRIQIAGGINRLGSYRLASTGGAKIGKKFETMDQIKAYLSEPVWSVHEYLGTNVEENTLRLPPVELVKKLLRLSGLPLEGADIEAIQMQLAKQLSFVNRLHNIPVEDRTSVEGYDARLMPRQTTKLNYRMLLDAVKHQKQDADIGEVSGSWTATGLAAESKNGYFVVREGLLKNRK
ncbi:glutamyl-tRNA(Gln) amidotransferase subunit F [Saccharomyces pastorianus]|uniref:Glutamyl-tRNA(Gln) amidotransferase subunit F, mitochondrial n=1 Tax=Saccharomyces pastorianus TaxID=27292 RepID=A0A6C1E738_SACPS|nr:glutamyl-tRNA(Gln) amidotransferase subunit F [Saccharomyces pastorianus]